MDERLQLMFETKGAEMSMPSTMSPEIRGKVVRRRFAYGGAAGLAMVAAIVALFVWVGGRDDVTPEFAPAEEGQVQPLSGKQLDAGDMTAGTYAIDEFELAPFTIEVGEFESWTPKIWGPGMFEMGGQGGYVTFHFEWDEVIPTEKALQGAVAAPADLTDWFLNHSALDVSRVRELTLDGTPATVFDASYNGLRPSPCGRGCWQVAPAGELWGGTMLLNEGEVNRLVVIQRPEGDVIVQLSGNGGFIERTTPLLERIDFAG